MLERNKDFLVGVAQGCVLGVLLGILFGLVVNPASSAEPHTVLVENLTVAPENRCERYNRNHYRTEWRTKQLVIENMGGVLFSPYTLKTYRSAGGLDADHIVALAEAHDSGACSWSRAKKRKFANDLDNLTLATQRMNRYQKKAADAGQWLPPKNRCWFAHTVLQVKSKWGLSVDKKEGAALLAVLKKCDSFAMAMPRYSALDLYDDNRDGRITCTEAGFHGIAPVRRGHPAYRFMHDGNNDGIVCR